MALPSHCKFAEADRGEDEVLQVRRQRRLKEGLSVCARKLGPGTNGGFKENTRLAPIPSVSLGGNFEIDVRSPLTAEAL